MKKDFPCGHKGKGQTCRRCLEAEKTRKKAYDQACTAGAFEFDQAREKAARLHARGPLLQSDLEWAGFTEDQAWRILNAAKVEALRTEMDDKYGSRFADDTDVWPGHG